MNYLSASVSLLLISGVLGLKAQNSPVVTLGTVSSTAAAVTVPLTATGFSNIGSGDLRIAYDPEVAVPSKVTLGPGMPGTFACNLNGTGIIKIGWFTYPPVTLTDSSVIFNIEFIRIRTGTSILRFDDGTVGPADCQFYNGSYQKLNDEPFSRYYLAGAITFTEPAGPVTTAPDLTASPGETVAVPVTVRAFKNVGAVSLVLDYDPAVLKFSSAENTGGFPGLIISNPVPGKIAVSGTTTDPDGCSLPDESVLFTLNFRYLGGYTKLNWNDEDGTSCEYSGPLSAEVFPDTPRSEYYHDGSVGLEGAPVAPSVKLNHPTCAVSTGEIEVTSPLGAGYAYSIDGTTYQSAAFFGDLFSGSYNVTVRNEEGLVSPITTAVIEKQPHIPVAPAVAVTTPTCEITGNAVIANFNADYTYTFSPEGPAIGSEDEITGFVFGQPYNVTAISSDGCTGAPSKSFVLEDRLEAPVPEITEEHRKDGTVILTAGEAKYYLWSTGAAIRSIEATITGEYWVEVTYKNGCSAVSPPLSLIISDVQLIGAATNRMELKVYPNPFSERLTIEFTSPVSAHACIEIYNLTGRLVQTVFNRQVNAGIKYNAQFVPVAETGGTYIYRMNIGGTVHTGSVVHSR